MITLFEKSKLESQQISQMLSLNAAKYIDDEVFIPMRKMYGKMSLSDLTNIFDQKLKIVYHSVYSQLHPLSEAFWSKPLNEEINIDEAFSALLLKFLSNLQSSSNIGVIFEEFCLVKTADLSVMFKRIQVCEDLLSFNISAFLLMSSFKFINNLGSELFLFSQRNAKVKGFFGYFDSIKEFFVESSCINNYLKHLSPTIDDNKFYQIIEEKLQQIVLVDAGSMQLYGVDGFTSYNLKIYIKDFDTEFPVLNQGATLYVLLHELCYVFRRISCRTWDESQSIPTPEECINGVPLSEADDIFEIRFFGKRHNFLNLSTCRFLISEAKTLGQEDLSRAFASMNEIRETTSIGLKRRIRECGASATLQGCAFRKYRNL